MCGVAAMAGMRGPGFTGLGFTGLGVRLRGLRTEALVLGGTLTPPNVRTGGCGGLAQGFRADTQGPGVIGVER